MPDPLPPDRALQSQLLLGPKVLLGMDTCGATGTVALMRVLSQASLPATDELQSIAQVELPGRSFSAQLVPAIANLLAKEGLAASDLAGVIAVAGPGSFTGVRVGLSAAKGLVQALEKPLIVLSRLATLAASIGCDTVLAVLDAGRGEYFCGEYRGQQCLREWLGTEASIAAATERGLSVVVCEAVLAERLGPFGPAQVPAPTAQEAIRYALPRFRAGDFDDPATADANYLRRSDAELFARTTAPAGATP